MGTFTKKFLIGSLSVMALCLGLGGISSHASAKVCRTEAKQCKLLRDKKQYKTVAQCMTDRYDDLNEACQSYILFRKGQFAETHAACQGDMSTFCSDSSNKRKCLQQVLAKERTALEKRIAASKKASSREVATNQAPIVGLSANCAHKLNLLNGQPQLPVLTN